MEQLLNRLESLETWKQDLKKACRRNKISISIASHFSPSKIRSFCRILTQKNQSSMGQKKKFWIQNQLRCYYWFCLAISCVSKKLIDQFTNIEWEIIQGIFPCKSLLVLQYEATRLVNQKQSQSKIWKEQQNDLLLKILDKKQGQDNKWNDIARNLYQFSEGQYFRTGKQCRQRWLNHLDPTKKHGKWSDQDDCIIAQGILSIGKKWSQIARLLKQRTEHMVKNRYKSILIKYRKIIGKSKSQNSVFQYITQKYGGNIIQFSNNTSNNQLKTRNQAMISETEYFPLKVEKSKSSLLMNKFSSIKEQRQQQDQKNIGCSAQNSEQLEKINQDIISSKQIKNIVSHGTNSSNFTFQGNNFFELQQIRSPSPWNQIASTPGYFNFSPNAPYFASFTQCETKFNSQQEVPN